MDFSWIWKTRKFVVLVFVILITLEVPVVSSSSQPPSPAPNTTMPQLFITPSLAPTPTRLRRAVSGPRYVKDMIGAKLSCYECDEEFGTGNLWRPDTDCQSNLAAAVSVRQCGEKDEWCMVNVVESTGIIASVNRMCVQTCDYGCKYSGFGQRTRSCTSCCRNTACNTEKDPRDMWARASHVAATPRRLIMMVSIVMCGVLL